MNEQVGDKIKRSIDENNMSIKSDRRIVLKIFNLTPNEYEMFIDFVKKKTPNTKGYEAIKILLNNYYKSVEKVGAEKNGKSI